MKEILTLFSTPIYSSKILNLKFNYIVDQIKKLNMFLDVPGLENSTEVYLIDKIPDLKQEIINHVNNYFYNILQYHESFKYYFPDSWVVKTTPDFKESKLHSHANSLYSGVVYLDTHDEGGDILFARSQTSFSPSINFLIPKKVKNTLNSDNWTITPCIGQILIFPSYIPHRILTNRSDSPRYSFAFNILPDNYKCDRLTGRVLDR
jgi:uncharacterized protein (TIGR02466 family)